ncbi:hypothetical protein DKG74_02165 [Zavarzinia aquatilis]|uniref:Calcium-binding protein n=2 Tax=Zavarzinia aquatilis TaxID=2211142 RepID=A0A317EK33_9PROT|nr:hypothetical protein DKG74_02165 [Zavarzinia aquatilis]
MSGGAGDDVYIVDDAGDTVTEAVGGGTDRVQVSVTWAADVSAEIEKILSRGLAAIDITGSDTANVIVANDAANVLSGLGGADRLNAKGGDDTLLGGDGDDTLIGGTGADAMTGGAGDDIYYVDDAGDTVVEVSGEGTDSVRLTASWTLGAGQAVEQLIARGSAALDITGNELANELFGNAGANVLTGGGGDDTIHAGAGDTVDGGSGADSIIVTGGGLGQIRVTGDSADNLSTTDAGWQAAGTVVLDGTSVERFVKGGVTLLVDAAVDTSGVQTAAMFGATVTTAGFDRQVVDTTTFGADRGFIIQGVTGTTQSGASVAAADVNGDGFDDIVTGIVGGGGGTEGEADIVFGGAGVMGNDVGGRQVVNLTTLSAAQGFAVRGGAFLDLFGYSSASAGDVNGDGYTDVIVGAPGGDDAGGDAGEAYVLFGGAGGFGTDVGGRQVINTTTLTAAQGFIIQADSAGDGAGWSVSAADVNRDGFSDLIVGARGGDDGGSNAGEVYVVFGGAGGFGTDVGGRQVIDLTNLSAAQGFIIQGDSAGDLLGRSASSAGDVNGDGFQDILVGAPYGSDGGSQAGEAYVIFGGAGGFGTDVGGRQVIDLTNFTAAQGFIIQGDSGGDRASWSISSAGDINGDGFADVAVGARYGDDGGTNAGEVYVVFGGAGGFGTDVGGRQVIDLTGLSAAQGFVIQGDTGSDLAGSSVAAAGDVNGDGFADIILGAINGGDGGSQAGEAYVLFGGSDGFGIDVGGRRVIDLTSLSADLGFIIQGDTTGDSLGTDVGAGDVNGDGFSDVIVGAKNGDDGGGTVGETYVIYGGPAGFSLAQVAGATDGDDTLTGTAAAERLIGGRGNDTLVGGGGADVFVGGAGNDTIDVGTGNFFRIDGGLGDDTLLTTGNLDFTLIDDVAIKGIETIDITGNGAQALVLDRSDVLAFEADNRDVLGTTHDGVLILAGDATDSVTLTGLTAAGSVSFGGGDWNLYAVGSVVVLAVDSDITLV